MSRPIEDYAMIGDGETVALINTDAGIDWLCWPRFDSDACFAALLGAEPNGHFCLRPAAPITRRARRYQPDTLIMETDLYNAHGGIRVIDFMPMRGTIPGGSSTIVRIVVGIQGRLTANLQLRLRFGYGLVPPWSEPTPTGLTARIGPDVVALHSPVPLRHADDAAFAEFEIAEGDRLAFTLRYSTADRPHPGPIDAEAALHATQRFWRSWITCFDDSRTRWPQQVRRSLITLKALVHQPSGGLVAAATTSLPETPAGTANWDYRYCWLRDAAFTVSALANAGLHDEAARWRDWTMRALGGSPGHLQVMYRVDGSRHMEERELPHLQGWREARPIRVGNRAVEQAQLDVFGELLYALDLTQRAGIPSTPQQDAMSRRVVDHLAEHWTISDSGVWEARGPRRRYTYSKAMAWVGLDCFIRRYDGDTAAHLRETADTIRAEVLEQGWHAGLGHFIQHYGGQALDASLLLLPLAGFIDANDPRMAATIDAINRDVAAGGLNEGGLIRRERPTADGPNEGAFLACSFWMAECLDLQGRKQEAVAQFERALATANDLGLFAEEFDVPGKHLAGNFPQALTHLALVDAALSLCGPVLGRSR